MKLVSTLSRFNQMSKATKFNIFAISLIILVTALSHGINLFEYPYYENDEATYTSRGWSVIEDGTLDPYTYRYDHPPVGWLTITAWQIFTGGTLVFGSLLQSARVFMLVLSVASAVLLYLTAQRLTQSRRASLIAVLMVALSPLAIYFQRRVLLDNIMTFFLILSLFFATSPKQHLRSYQLSAISFGLAVLSKLTAVFAGPAILLMIFFNARKVNQSYAVFQWLVISGLMVLLFVIFSVLKGEFLPAELDEFGRPENVSLVETTREQLSRGDFSAPWRSDSFFWQNMLDWLRRDAVLLVAGLYGLIATILMSFKKKTYLVISLYMIAFLLFLARGKLVFNHYILPVLPGLALVIAGGLSTIETAAKKWVSFDKTRAVITSFAMLLLFGFGLTSFSSTIYQRDENANLIAAEQWILDNVDNNEIVILDNYAYPTLHYENDYKNAFYMFPAEYDPDVRKVYKNNWRNIDYILVTHEIYRQINNGSLPTIQIAFENAERVASFRGGSTSFIDDEKYISTNGDWAEIYKVNPNKVAGE